MIILKPITAPQQLKFISRSDSADLLTIRDEQNNTETEISGTFSLSTYYLTSSLVFNLTLVSDFITRVESDGGTVEAQSCFAEFETLREGKFNIFREGDFYNLTVYKTLVSNYITRVEADGGTVEAQSCFAEFNIYEREVVYKDKIFCTDQAISDYTINKGEYKEHSTENEFMSL